MRTSLLVKYRPSPALAVAIVALVVALSGVAYATIPNSSGVISGCYSKLTGALRVINAPTQTCSRAQIAISWNQTGPQGQQGETGPQGPPGPGDVIGGSLDVAYGPNSDPGDGPWTTFLSIPNVADVQVWCGSLGNMQIQLVNTSSSNLLFAGSPSEIAPGESTTLSGPAEQISLSPLLFEVVGGSETVTIQVGGETGEVLPAIAGECHAVGQATVAN